MSEISVSQFVELFSNVSNSTKSIFDLASRTDERVKLMMDKQQELEEKIDKMIENQANMIQRITYLEANSNSEDMQEVDSRIRNLEIKTQELQIHTYEYGSKWKNLVSVVINFITLIVGAAAGAYVQWKLNGN